MKAVSKRICHLEARFGLGPSAEQKLWVVTIVGRRLALDENTCVGILRECGFLPTHRFGVVDLSRIPDGLNAKETERFLRERGGETCGLNGAR